MPVDRDLAVDRIDRAVPSSVDGVERQQVCGSFRSTGGFVDVDKLQVSAAPPGAQRQPSHPAEAVDANPHRHSAPAIYSDFRMAVALDGQAEVNSIDV